MYICLYFVFTSLFGQGVCLLACWLVTLWLWFVCWVLWLEFSQYTDNRYFLICVNEVKSEYFGSRLFLSRYFTADCCSTFVVLIWRSVDVRLDVSRCMIRLSLPFCFVHSFYGKMKYTDHRKWLKNSMINIYWIVLGIYVHSWLQ